MSSLIVTRWGGWHCGRRWRWFWFWVSAAIWWRWTLSFVTPAFLRILCCAIWARKAAVCLSFTNHSHVYFHCSIHIPIPRELNSARLLISDLRVRFPDQVSHFLYCGAQKPSFGHLPIFMARCMLDYSSCTGPPCLAIVADVVQTYKKLGVYFWKWDSANTSTTYTSVASSRVCKWCFVYSQGCLSRYLPARFPELTASWCSILRIVRMNALVKHGGFPLRFGINWSLNSLHRLAVHHKVSYGCLPWYRFTHII